jgi:hypothetical protein
MKTMLVALALLVLSAPASAQSAGDVTVEAPWARASLGMAKAGAAYMTLHNTGTAPDRLLSAETPVAEVAELHTHLMDDGVMRMRQVRAVEVAPGSGTVLQPGGLHVMLMGLKAPLKAGETFPLTLTFERGGETTVEVAVRSLGEGAPRTDGHGRGQEPSATH